MKRLGTITNLFVFLIARSALYVRRVVKIRCTVRPYDVRIIIDFPLRHNYEGWTHVAQQWDFENPTSEKLVKKGSMDWTVDSSELESLFGQLFANFFASIVTANFIKNGRFAPLPCTVYLVYFLNRWYQITGRSSGNCCVLVVASFLFRKYKFIGRLF